METKNQRDNPIGLFGERKDSTGETKRKCLTCRFYRFVELSQWCGHPKLNRRVKRPTRSCKRWIDRDEKSGGLVKVDYEESYSKYKAEKDV